MKKLIKKILSESKLDVHILDKVYNLIKGDFWFEHNRDYRDGQVVTSFHTPDGEQIKGVGGGIGYQLGDESPLVRNIIPTLSNTFGLSIDESFWLWEKIRFDLAKDRFLYSLVEVLYEDYIQYQEDPYIFDKGMEGGDGFFNLRKLEGLKSFVKWAGYGNNQRGVQYEGVYNYLDAITDSEYKILHQEMLEYIERDLH
jgi:hypothetical protein